MQGYQTMPKTFKHLAMLTRTMSAITHASMLSIVCNLHVVRSVTLR